MAVSRVPEAGEREKLEERRRFPRVPETGGERRGGVE
jgi:hypothetical protein